MRSVDSAQAGGSITVAASQMACGWDRDANIAAATGLVEQAAAQGAEIILLQELFATPYFCKDQNPDYFELAETLEDSPTVRHFSMLAQRLNVVLPISYFERAGNAYFNSLVVIDADGKVLENYRKSHIPNGPGYQEKQYFSPGDTGFKVWPTRFGTIGVAICWDQWFPEAARAMVLAGAEILFYPTAIGSEPQDPNIDSMPHWRRTMQGHAAANMIPVVASNRIGLEEGESCNITFYGSSFIADARGALVAEMGRSKEGVILQTFDRHQLRKERAAWGMFRDRRPELYTRLNGY